MRVRSERHTARGLSFHVSRWGGEDGTPPALVLLHGWGDCGETFTPLLEQWARHAPVAAPDMRGFGRSEHVQGDYLFADYIPDVHALLAQLSPERPVALAGHSMGAQIASLYAGVCPERVSHLVILDGLFLPDSAPERAPRRYRNWLHQLDHPPQARCYDSFEQLAERIRVQHPALDEARAMHIAHAWAETRADGVWLRMDPRHRMRGPVPFRAAESMAVWREITAPTLFVDGADSPFARAISKEETAARRACFREHSSCVIPGAGHMLHFDAAPATAAAVETWLLDLSWPVS